MLHRALQEFQRSPAIPALRHEDLKHLTFVIYPTPEIMRLSIDPDEYRNLQWPHIEQTV